MTTLYRRRVPLFWWAQSRSYLAFILRELSSVFVAWFVAYLLLFVRAVASGPESYRAFLDLAATPWMLAINVVALGFVGFHTVTWFSLTPQAMDVRLPRIAQLPEELRGLRVPSWMILAQQYAALVVVSVFVVWLVLYA